MFPSLDTLILANNNLTTIEESEDSLARLFPNLRSINLHKSGESQEAGRGFLFSAQATAIDHVSPPEFLNLKHACFVLFGTVAAWAEL